MSNTRFSLRDYDPAQRTSLENILDKTNDEYVNEYKSLTEKEAIINKHRLQFQSSLKKSKNRIQNLLKYSNELEMKRNMIDSDRATLESQITEAYKFLESEIKITEETFSRTQHELELILQKLTYTKSNSEQLQKKLNDLENFEKKLNERQIDLENKIQKSNQSLPKRSPDKIKQEINVLNRNIPEVNKQIQNRENYIVQREMRRIQSQNDRLKLNNQIESIKKGISELLQKSDIKNESARIMISSKIDKLTSLETARVEKKIIINNIKSRIEFQEKKIDEITNTLKNTIQKVEDTKNVLTKKSNETELSKQKSKEFKESIENLISKRKKNDSNKVSELLTIRKEYKKTQKNCGAELYRIQQNRNQKKELKETLKNCEQQLFQIGVEFKKLKLEEKELNQLEEEIQEQELNEERQFKLDIITLDDLQKNIGRGQLETKKIMKDQLELLSPVVKKIDQYKNYEETEKKFDDETQVFNTSMNIKDLEKDLNQIYSSIEDLKFECTKFKEQINYNKQQLLLKKVDLEHARNIQQYFEHEILSTDENEPEEKLIQVKIKEFEVNDLIRKIEKKNEMIFDRKRNLKTRLIHIKEVLESENMKNFENNVSLAVAPDFPHYTNNDFMPKSNSLPIYKINIDKIINFDKLQKLYRTIQIEKGIWRSLVNPSSITSILETWNDQLQKFLD